MHNRHHHHHFGRSGGGPFGDPFRGRGGRGRGGPDGSEFGGGSGRRPGHGPDSDGRGRRRRLFDGEQLRLMILALIGEEDRHGYELIRALDERSGGVYAPSPGMVYPLLALLADEGLIAEVDSQSSRKSFTLTEEGKALRDRTNEEAKLLFTRLGALAESRRHVDSEPARRAMHNLRSALVGRLSRDDVTSETVFEAVALIDSVAQAIERL